MLAIAFCSGNLFPYRGAQVWIIMESQSGTVHQSQRVCFTKAKEKHFTKAKEKRLTDEEKVSTCQVRTSDVHV